MPDKQAESGHLQTSSSPGLIARLLAQPGEAIALRHDGQCMSYATLLGEIAHFSSKLESGLPGKPDDSASNQSLKGARIALMLPAGFDYVVALLSIWCAGGIAVPLNVSTSQNDIRYALKTARVSRMLSDDQHMDKVAGVCSELHIFCDKCQLLRIDETIDGQELIASLIPPAPTSRALLLFTSGTTNKPKGVITSHAAVSAQINTLLAAWHWRADDVIPLFLPMHHVHGIINVLCCALAAGASVDIFSHFDMPRIFERVAEHRYSLFMAVPTIYVKMIRELEESLASEEANAICRGFSGMRLMISGSAACPTSVHKSWQTLTNQTLLERYGMTEIGMALSNPYEGERRAGSVGQPLPGVKIKLVDEQGQEVSEEQSPGEIRVKGANVFMEYWDNPQATRETFSEDGWFKSGDIAVIENGYYRILGRSSVDIIKTGGEKVSALEIESALLEHPDIVECAVLGLADEMWGEAITAAVVLNAESAETAQSIISWCKSCMSPYKVPKRVELLKALPRNAMGKVTKPAIKKMLEEGAA